MAQPARKLTREDVDRIAEQVSNWGRWGADDQRGALNLITNAKRVLDPQGVLNPGVLIDP